MASTSIQLTDLDDACIQAVFSFLHPLPDLFNVAASCRRLRDLALDRKSWIVVSLTASEPVIGVPKQYRQLFQSLQEAISASRPGDTIFLQPGVYKVADLVISRPIHIMGGGLIPEETLLVSSRGADTALDFRASGKLFNLSIRSQLGSCITHHCGKLSVEQVAMECDTEGLDHLVSPMATLAVSPGATPCSGHLALPHAHPARKRKSEMEEGGRMLAGPGVLSVVESKIKGGLTAIQLLGSGELSSVRAIYRSQYTLLWFTVDSAVPGWPQGSAWKRGAAELEQQVQSERGRAHAGRGGEEVDSRRCSLGDGSGGGQGGLDEQLVVRGSLAPSPLTPVLPAWMRRPPFDPATFQRRVHAEMAQQKQQNGGGRGEGVQQQMQKKARQWSWHHAAALQST